MFGLHASMTLSEETLRTCAGLAADLGVGCHIHVAEDLSDVQDSLQKYGCRVVERLDRAGILGERTIAAHCVHVSEQEQRSLARTRTNIVHNPRSNMNNAVGVADVPGMLERGMTPGLGNDGFSNNIFAEMHVAYLVHKLAQRDPRTMSADQIVQIAFAHNARIAAQVGLPQDLGTLKVGAPADIIIVDYDPITPLTAGNAPWHLLFGVDGTAVETTIVGGRVLMEKRQLLTLDVHEITHHSRLAAQSMWERR
jgi:cytosine/adenosine deaminase-related metal-dependent hydrolase